MTAAAPIGSTSGAVSEAVAKVEAQLASFWSSPDAGGDATAKVRASTLNYVIICAPQDADAYRESTEQISQTHGGRTLLLTLSGRIAPWDLVPDIHAVCRLEGSVPVCYDRVDLTFGAVAASRAASVIQTLALPELPTVVEVGGGAPAPLVDTAAAKFNRLIVDSSKTSVTSLAKLIRPASCAVADRAMIHTYAWRELTARFFDDAVAALSEIRGVHVARTPAAPAANDPAPLFLGWLASRLGWSFTSRREARDRAGRAIEISLAEEGREGLRAGQLTAVHIRAALGGEPLDLSIDRVGASPSVTWRTRGARTTDREAPLGSHGETWVAIKAIDATEGDAVTREALLAAAEWEALS